jgi:hypothetical protein
MIDDHVYGLDGVPGVSHIQWVMGFGRYILDGVSSYLEKLLQYTRASKPRSCGCHRQHISRGWLSVCVYTCVYVCECVFTHWKGATAG